MKRELLLCFLLIIFAVGIEAKEFKTTASYDGNNINIGNSLLGEHFYISNIKGTNNDTNYCSLSIRNKQMIEVNDGIYYILNYSAQFDRDFNETDDNDKKNTFIKINSNTKFAKYISSNMFLNIYIDLDYKDFIATSDGKYIAVAPKIEAKFPKNNLTLNVKADCKYFLKKKNKMVDIYENINGTVVLIERKMTDSYKRRIDKGVEITLSKEVTDSIYLELFTSYGETNNNKDYGTSDYTKTNVPDLNSVDMSVSYGYLGWTPYSGDIGTVTLYGMYEKDIQLADNEEGDSITNGFVYGKGGIKWIGEVGITGSYEYRSETYSISSYIKKSF